MRSSSRPLGTGATQRLRSSRTGSPGSSEAVWPSSPRPSRVRSSSGRPSLEHVRAVKTLQHRLVANRPPHRASRRPFPPDACSRRRRHMAQKGGARHAEIAGRIGRRHEALIAQNPMHPVPGQPGLDRLLAEPLIEWFRRVAAGQGDDACGRHSPRQGRRDTRRRLVPARRHPHRREACQMPASYMCLVPSSGEAANSDRRLAGKS